jgi:hypothetical protein
MKRYVLSLGLAVGALFGAGCATPSNPPPQVAARPHPRIQAAERHEAQVAPNGDPTWPETFAPGQPEPSTPPR